MVSSKAYAPVLDNTKTRRRKRMAQNYLWRVVYVMREGYFGIRKTYEKVFKNKLQAMSFVSRLRNNSKCERVTMSKWKGC
jgi:hypothetical protein